MSDDYLHERLKACNVTSDHFQRMYYSTLAFYGQALSSLRGQSKGLQRLSRKLKRKQAEIERLRAEVASIRERTARECAEICYEYPLRDPAGDGDGYWASGECKNQILKRFGLEGDDFD